MDTSPVPLLKPPVWTFEVPLYFFVGGAAGAGAVIAALAGLNASDTSIAEHARWVAAGGAILAPPLLVSDLGRPSRFLNMLRVFKLRSPMSVGAWTLAVFSAAAVASLVTHEFANLPSGVAGIGTVAAIVAALTGLLLATYTGVLIGVTAIPIWAAHVRELPLLFGLSGLGAAVSCIELLGDRTTSMNLLGLLVAAMEMVCFIWVERQTRTERRAIDFGSAAPLIRTSEMLSGPIAFLVRATSIWVPAIRLVASVAVLAGSALTRFAWIAAGRVSAQDRESALR